MPIKNFFLTFTLLLVGMAALAFFSFKTQVLDFFRKYPAVQESTESLFPLGKVNIESSASSTEEPKKEPSVEETAKFCARSPIIMYHHIQSLEDAEKYNQGYLTVEPKTFENHIKYLKSKDYTFVSVVDIIEAIKSEKRFAGKTIAITLDDAYSDIFDNAYPVAKKYKVILNVMVPTALVDKGGYLTWEQIKEMDKSGFVKFYNHTNDHSDLRSLSAQGVAYEINTAQNLLDKNLGSRPKVLAYPSGYYSNDVIGVVTREGFIGALGTESGVSECDSNLFHLQRLRIANFPLSDYGF